MEKSQIFYNLNLQIFEIFNCHVGIKFVADDTSDDVADDTWDGVAVDSSDGPEL